MENIECKYASKGVCANRRVARGHVVNGSQQSVFFCSVCRYRDVDEAYKPPRDVKLKCETEEGG